MCIAPRIATTSCTKAQLLTFNTSEMCVFNYFFQDDGRFLERKSKLIFPGAKLVGLFYDSTKTFINLAQTTICFSFKSLGEWTSFAATV